MIERLLPDLQVPPKLSSDQQAYEVYATHHLDGVRVDTGPKLVIADGPDTYQKTKDWLFEDTKIVDIHIKPIPKAEYRHIRHDVLLRKLTKTAVRSILLLDSLEKK